MTPSRGPSSRHNPCSPSLPPSLPFHPLPPSSDAHLLRLPVRALFLLPQGLPLVRKLAQSKTGLLEHARFLLVLQAPLAVQLPFPFLQEGTGEREREEGDGGKGVGSRRGVPREASRPEKGAREGRGRGSLQGTERETDDVGRRPGESRKKAMVSPRRAPTTRRGRPGTGRHASLVPPRRTLGPGSPTGRVDTSTALPMSADTSLGQPQP